MEENDILFFFIFYFWKILEKIEYQIRIEVRVVGNWHVR